MLTVSNDRIQNIVTVHGDVAIFAGCGMQSLRSPTRSQIATQPLYSQSLSVKKAPLDRSIRAIWSLGSVQIGRRRLGDEISTGTRIGDGRRPFLVEIIVKPPHNHWHGELDQDPFSGGRHPVSLPGARKFSSAPANFTPRR